VPDDLTSTRGYESDAAYILAFVASAIPVLAIVVATMILYRGGDIFLPITLAIILAVIVTPLCSFLEPYLGRFFSAALVVILALVLRLMGSDSLVVEHATGVSGGEAPVDFEFGAIRPPVPGAGALAQFGKRRNPLPPQALSRPQAGFQFGRIKPAPVLGGVVHRESPPQPVSRLRTEGGGERLFPMRVEIIQHQMNGARRGVTARDPIKCARKFSRGTVRSSVGLMATGFGLDPRRTHWQCRTARTRSRGARAGLAPSQ
jgi:hypothetical protein